MKPVEIVLRGGEGERGRRMEGANPTKIYRKHICKHHHVSSAQLLHAKQTNKQTKKQGFTHARQAFYH
jgi:hypothetical protein